MTRTERSFNPRAIIRDRSESKSGLDKSPRKGGAGAHNWGSYADEQNHEYGAVEDYYEEDDAGVLLDAEHVAEHLASGAGSKTAHDGSFTERRQSASALSEQERQQAREFRARALKEGSDLVAIARTSAAVSSSPPSKTSTVTVATDAQTSVMP